MLNVDIENGKVRLYMPEQGTSTASALQVEPPITRLTPLDENPLMSRFMKPSTSSTQPPIFENSSGKSEISRQSQHSQIVNH
jgi:hypothetical protein